MSESLIQFIPPIPIDDHSPPAIPIDIPPGIISAYSAAVADAIQVPYELALVNVLGTVAATAQRKIRISPYDGYSEPVNIYALAILPPGERKSAVKDICRRPLLDWEVEQQQIVANDITLSQAEYLVLEEVQRSLITSSRKCKTLEERREVAKKIAELKKEAPVLESIPRLLADDTTPEALAALMAENNQRIAMIEAEGGFFDTLAGRYSSGVPNLDAVLKSWNGESVRIDRRHSDPIILNDPALTLILSAQPDVLKGLTQTSSFKGRGLIGRFLFLTPNSLVGSRAFRTSPIPNDLKQAYAATIRRLITLPWRKNNQGKQLPYELHLDEKALRVWLNFAEKTELDLAEGGHLSSMRDWGGKLPGQALRLAALCHVTLHETPQNHLISETTMQATLQLARLITEHTKVALNLMGTDNAMECAKAILKWITEERLKTFKGRDCLEKIKGRWPTMSLVNPGLNILKERGYIIEQIHTDEKRLPGRPAKIYTVNPLSFGVQS